MATYAMVSNQYWGTDYQDFVNYSARTSNVTLYGFGGDDALQGGSGNDYIYGGTGGDTLLGNAGNDQIFGEDGNDYINGGSGTDSIDGGPGNDRITGGGGVGNDYLTGGAGADVFYIGLGDSVPAGGGLGDMINDFSDWSGDRIDMDVAGTAQNFVRVATNATLWSDYLQQGASYGDMYAAQGKMYMILQNATQDMGVLFADLDHNGHMETVVALTGVGQSYEFGYWDIVA